MGLRPTPTQRQRRLGAELRRLRFASGMSAADAGALVGLGTAHLSHIENGRTAIPEAKLRTLAENFGCKDEVLIDALVAMSDSTGRGWWWQHRKTHPASLLDIAELEASAAAHKSFQWIHVPGLLQTADYMRALFEGGEPDASPGDVEAYIEFRLQRQQILHSEAPPLFHAIIHEAALHMQFVGVDVMRRQVEHLIDMAKLPHVSIQIVPFKSAVYPANHGTPFILFDTSAPALSTVYVEHPVSALFLGEPDEISQYTRTFEKLSHAALPALDPRPERESYSERTSLRLVQHLLYVL